MRVNVVIYYQKKKQTEVCSKCHSAKKKIFVGGGVRGSVDRSEERRVGKEGRSRWSPYH